MSGYALPSSPRKDGSSAASPLATSPANPNGSNASFWEPALPYSPNPPAWRPLLHPGSESMSYPDFYPSRSGRASDLETEKGLQLEDDMNATHVRQGMTARQAVMNESFSAHGLILSLLPQLVPTLNSIFVETLQRRSYLTGISLASNPRPHVHKAPPRVTLNDVKLSAYVRDLSDPTVPLARLAKSIPHGFRGERMLEMLWQGVNPVGHASAATTATTKMTQTLSSLGLSGGSAASEMNLSQSVSMSVEIPRALWFIRTIGASDLATRSRSAATISAQGYTVDFTTTCISWLRKQLNEIPIRADDSIRDAPLDAKKWVDKWRYSLLLMDALQTQSLLDRRTWCTFIVTTIETGALKQLPFALALVQESIQEILGNDQLTKRLAVAALLQYDALEMSDFSSNSTFGKALLTQWGDVLRVIWCSSPSFLISPRLWTCSGESRLRRLLQFARGANYNVAEHNRQVDIVRDRSRALKNGREAGSDDATTSSRATLHHIIGSLDNYSTLTTSLDDIMDSLTLRGPVAACSLLAEWATTTLRPSKSSWRPVLAAKLIHRLDSTRKPWGSRKSNGPRQPATARPWAQTDLNHIMSQWVEDIGETQHTVDFDRLVLLLAELVRHGSFSYLRFLHRLTARAWMAVDSDLPTNGATGPPLGTTSLQFRLMRSLPIPPELASPALFHQRRLAIYGSRTKETREEASYRRGYRELMDCFDFLTVADVQENTARSLRPIDEILNAMPHVIDSSLYVKRQLISGHLLPIASQWLTGLMGANVTVERIALVVTVTEATGDWSSLAQLMQRLLECLALPCPVMSVRDGLVLIRDILIAHQKLWLALDVFSILGAAFAGLAHSVLSKTKAEEATSAFKSASLRSFDLLLRGEDTVDFPDTLLSINDAFQRFVAGDSDEDDRRLLATSINRSEVQCPLDGLIGRKEAAFASPPGIVKDYLIYVKLCQEALLSPARIIDCLVLPSLDVAASAHNGTLAADACSALHLCNELMGKAWAPREHIRMRAALLDQKTYQTQLKLATTLAALLNIEGLDGLPISLVNSILQHTLLHEGLRDAITALPSLLSDAIRSALKTVWSNPWGVVWLMYSQLGRASPLISNLPSPLDLDPMQVLPLLDTWRRASLLEELSFIFEQLAVVEGGQQGRADVKVVKCCQALFDPLFLGGGSESNRLWEAGGNACRVALIETAWKTLAYAEQKEEVGQSSSVLRLMFNLARKTDSGQLPSTSADSTDKVFLLLLDRLRAAQRPSGLSLNRTISILQALLLSESFWTTTVVSQHAAEIVQLLLDLLAVHSAEDRGATSAMLYDVIAYMLEEMPADVLATLPQAVRGQTNGSGRDIFHEHSSTDHSRAIKRLSPWGITTQHTASTCVVEIDSTTCVLAPENPWKWAEPLDQSASGTTVNLARSHSSAMNVVPAAAAAAAPTRNHTHHLSPLTLPALENGACISLQHFGPKRSIVVPLSIDQDYEALQLVSEGYPRVSAGDDDAEGWRCMPSEKTKVFEMVEDIRDGKTLMPVTHLVAPSDLEGTIEVGEAGFAIDGKNNETARASKGVETGRKAYEALSRLVGLPAGQVRTMEGHLKDEREKRARESRERREQKAALNQPVVKMNADRQHQRQQQRGAHQAEGEAGLLSTLASDQLLIPDQDQVPIALLFEDASMGEGPVEEKTRVVDLSLSTSVRKRKVSLNLGGESEAAYAAKKSADVGLSGQFGRAPSRGKRKSG